MTNDYIVYPAQGTGTRAGVRMTSTTWLALKAAAEAAGAPATEGHYSPLDSVGFAKAAVRGLGAVQAPQAGVPWGRVPANVPMKAPTSPLVEPANFARALEVLALFSQGLGIVVERVAAAEHRANVVR